LFVLTSSLFFIKLYFKAELFKMASAQVRCSPGLLSGKGFSVEHMKNQLILQANRVVICVSLERRRNKKNSWCHLLKMPFSAEIITTPEYLSVERCCSKKN
jgi:hypothetical protein